MIEVDSRGWGVSGASYRLESGGKILVLVTGARFTTDELLDEVGS